MSDGLISLILAMVLFVGVVGVSLRYAFSKERDIQEHLRRAQTYRSRKNYDAAVGAYQRVIELDPENITALQGVGILHTQLGRYNEAILAYEVLVKIEPQDHRVLNRLAQLYEKVGNRKLGRRPNTPGASERFRVVC